MIAKKGSVVKVEYEGSFEDGKVFDASAKHGKPLEFTIGANMVVQGFNDGVIGMKVGDSREIRITPEHAYGPSNPKAIFKVPRDKIPPQIQENMLIGIPVEGGKFAPAKIAKIEDDFVTVDMNHPLAGKVLIFKIKLVEVK